MCHCIGLSVRQKVDGSHFRSGFRSEEKKNSTGTGIAGERVLANVESICAQERSLALDLAFFGLNQ